MVLTLSMEVGYTMYVKLQICWQYMVVTTACRPLLSFRYSPSCGEEGTALAHGSPESRNIVWGSTDKNAKVTSHLIMHFDRF